MVVDELCTDDANVGEADAESEVDEEDLDDAVSDDEEDRLDRRDLTLVEADEGFCDDADGVFAVPEEDFPDDLDDVLVAYPFA